MTKTPRGWHSRGYLPHYDGGAIPQSITIHLFDSLPKHVIERWLEELKHRLPKDREVALRKRIDKYLDKGYGSSFLNQHPVATKVEDSMLYFDEERYKLSAWVVMPNHAHMLLTPFEGYELSDIMHSIKSYTANEANRLLCREGQFWQEDYFDRAIRDGKHFRAVVKYIEMNPVKAGLCKHPEDWPFSSASWERRHPAPGSAGILPARRVPRRQLKNKHLVPRDEDA